MYKLIICIYACDIIPKYKEEILTIKNTYELIAKKFKDELKILFFVGEEIILEDENIINLKNVKNDYLSASYKQYNGIKYIYNNYDTQFIYVIGTDAYINIPKVLNLLLNYDYKESLYIGGHGCIRNIEGKQIYFHSGGPGFIISKEFVKQIYPIIDNIDNFMNKWFLICENSNNNSLKPACDVSIAYLADIINANIVKLNGFYNCNHYGYPCCIHQHTPNDVISCHNMTTNDFYDFTRLLENNNYYC